MRKIVLDTNCLLMSLPKISPYRMIWDEFLKGQLILCVSNEIIEEYMEILTQKTNSEILGGRIYGYNKVDKGRGSTPLEGF